MRSKPDKCYEVGCPLAVLCTCSHHENAHPEHGHCTHLNGEVLCECNGFQSKGRGFVLGVGDPEKARLAIFLEAPGQEEVSFPIEGVGAPGIIPRDELERRGRDYPDLLTAEGVPSRFLKVGAPVVGKSGSLLNQWVLPKVGVLREQIYVDNTLRCLPPKNKQGQPYPIGVERAQAEGCCRVWDRVGKFQPELVEITLHPAGILREVTPLPLLIKDMEKAVAGTKRGLKTLLLMGGKAAEVFLGYGDNVTRWRGHYEVLTKGWGAWYDRVREKLEKRGKKGKKGKKVGKGEKIDQMVLGMGEDVLETPSTELPKFKRKGRKKKDVVS